jgi:lysophospholipase L1-like esterase
MAIAPRRQATMPISWFPRMMLAIGGLAVGVAAAEISARTLGLPHVYHRIAKPPQFTTTGADAAGHVTYVNKLSSHIRFAYDGDPRGYFGQDHDVDHVTNARGFRGPEFEAAKPAGTRRIVFLGDSSTFGEGVRFDDTYPEVAVRELRGGQPPGAPRIEAMNFGVGGYNTEDEARLFEKTVLSFAPDAVVLGYGPNDAEGPLFTFDRTTGAIVRRARESKVPEGVADAPPPREGLFALRLAQLAWQVPHARAVTAATVSYYERINAEDSAGWRDSMASLREIISVCADHHIPTVVVLFPVLVDLDDYPLADIDERMRTTLAGTSAAVVDLLPLLRSHRTDALWVHPTDQHPNDIVDAIAGRAVAAALRWTPAIDATATH